MESQRKGTAPILPQTKHPPSLFHTTLPFQTHHGISQLPDTTQNQPWEQILEPSLCSAVNVCLLPEQHSLKNCKTFQISRIGGSLRIPSAPAKMTFLYRTNQLARSSLSLLTLWNIQAVAVWMAEFTVQTPSTLPKPWSTSELSSTRLHCVLQGFLGVIDVFLPESVNLRMKSPSLQSLFNHHGKGQVCLITVLFTV